MHPILCLATTMFETGAYGTHRAASKVDLKSPRRLSCRLSEDEQYQKSCESCELRWGGLRGTVSNLTDFLHMPG